MKFENALHELIMNIHMDYEVFESKYKDYYGGLYPSVEEKKEWELKMVKRWSNIFKVNYVISQ